MQYFNPRLREGGDGWLDCESSAVGISIHASAKEATSLSHTIKLSFRISIHASAKEATSIVTLPLLATDFNPRLREGGDNK